MFDSQISRHLLALDRARCGHILSFGGCELRQIVNTELLFLFYDHFDRFVEVISAEESLVFPLHLFPCIDKFLYRSN